MVVERTSEAVRAGQQRICPAVWSRARLLCASLPLLCVCLSSRQAAAQAATSAGQPISGGTVNLGTIPVTAAALNPDGSTPQSGGLTVAAPSFGPLGNVPARDIPFSTFSVPRTVLRDQQPKTLTETLKNDPSVNVDQAPLGPSATQGAVAVRGFGIDAGDYRQDGLSLETSQFFIPEDYERVDVLRGAASALYGFASPGGVVNFVTKAPLPGPLTSYTQSYTSRATFEEAVDASRRFGPNDQFGVRVNLGQEHGDYIIDHSSIDRDFETVALDDKPVAGLRVWTNLQHQWQDNEGIQTAFQPRGLLSIPRPANPFNLVGEPWYHNKLQQVAASAGVDLQRDGWTVRVSAIYAQLDEPITGPYYGPIRSDGSFRIAPNSQYTETAEFQNKSAVIYVARAINTGPVHQLIAVDYEPRYYINTLPDQTIAGPDGSSDIHDPVYMPPVVFPPTRYILSHNRTSYQTATLTDRIDFGRQWTLLAGVTRATYDGHSGGIGRASTATRQAQTTPIAALLYKPIPQVTAYFSYIEALTPGSSAPLNAVNAGVLLPPFTAHQYEVGVKADATPGLTVDADLFRIDQAYAFLDPATNVYSENGTETHEGAEVTVSGKVTSSLGLLGGVTWFYPEVSGAANAAAATDNLPVGVPRIRTSLFATYDVPGITGLTLLGGLYVNGPAPIARSTDGRLLKLPAYVTVDAGATYDFKLWHTPFHASAYVSNLLNQGYWVDASFLEPGLPLTAHTALTVSF